jgi:hypothetical protein
MEKKAKFEKKEINFGKKRKKKGKVGKKKKTCKKKKKKKEQCRIHSDLGVGEQ